MPKLAEKDKKSAIMKAALKLLVNNGFDATPVSAIAREAGVAAGTIYIYFPNKQELIKELYLAEKEVFAKQAMSGVNLKGPIKEAIYRIWKNNIEHALKYPLGFRFYEQFVNSPQIDRLTREQGARLVKPIIDQFERGKKEGVIRNMPNEMIQSHLFSPMISIMKSHQNDPEYLTREMIEFIFETSWRAIGA